MHAPSNSIPATARLGQCVAGNFQHGVRTIVGNHSCHPVGQCRRRRGGHVARFHRQTVAVGDRAHQPCAKTCRLQNARDQPARARFAIGAGNADHFHFLARFASQRLTNLAVSLRGHRSPRKPADQQSARSVQPKSPRRRCRSLVECNRGHRRCCRPKPRTGRLVGKCANRQSTIARQCHRRRKTPRRVAMVATAMNERKILFPASCKASMPCSASPPCDERLCRYSFITKSEPPITGPSWPDRRRKKSIPNRGGIVAISASLSRQLSRSGFNLSVSPLAKAANFDYATVYG